MRPAWSSLGVLPNVRGLSPADWAAQRELPVQAGVMRRRRRDALVESWRLRLGVATARPGWRELAACRGVDIGVMFCDDGNVWPALALCATCPVRLSCLGAARLEESDEPHLVSGVRGGLTAPQRAATYRELGMRGRPLVAECGTDAGYSRHLKRGEATCASCRAAHARRVADVAARRRRRSA